MSTKYLGKERFPNNRQICDLVIANALGTAVGAGTPSHGYNLASRRIGPVIELILAGSKR